MSERTTISLSKNNYEKLKEIGKFGESFDDIVSRMLSKDSSK